MVFFVHYEANRIKDRKSLSSSWFEISALRRIVRTVVVMVFSVNSGIVPQAGLRMYFFISFTV